MSGEKDLEQIKREAAAKARAAAQEKLKARKSSASTSPDSSAQATVDAKARAAAAAKARAAAEAKVSLEESPATDDASAKSKAAAAAKAKAAAAAKARAQAKSSQSDDEKAKAIAIAKAKAAAAAKAKGKTGGKKPVEEEQLPPSPNQKYLDKYVKVITDHLGDDVLEDYYINRQSKDVPTLIVKKESYFKVAEFLKYNEQLSFDYLTELHGTDFKTYMELYVHLFSYKNKQRVVLKVKLDRNKAEINSVERLWAGANWPECEAYDLLGINFIGHPNLHRIMLGEDWVGHPLRKDYEQAEVEV